MGPELFLTIARVRVAMLSAFESKASPTVQGEEGVRYFIRTWKEPNKEPLEESADTKRTVISELNKNLESTSLDSWEDNAASKMSFGESISRRIGDTLSKYDFALSTIVDSIEVTNSRSSLFPSFVILIFFQ